MLALGGLVSAPVPTRTTGRKRHRDSAYRPQHQEVAPTAPKRDTVDVSGFS